MCNLPDISCPQFFCLSMFGVSPYIKVVSNTLRFVPALSSNISLRLLTPGKAAPLQVHLAACSVGWRKDLALRLTVTSPVQPSISLSVQTNNILFVLPRLSVKPLILKRFLVQYPHICLLSSEHQAL